MRIAFIRTVVVAEAMLFFKFADYCLNDHILSLHLGVQVELTEIVEDAACALAARDLKIAFLRTVVVAEAMMFIDW